MELHYETARIFRPRVCFTFPKVALKKSQLDIGNDIANWGYDDIWRIFWMTLMFCVLFPLSRSGWALKKNFSLSMWLHIVSACTVLTVSTERRVLHEGSWALNCCCSKLYVRGSPGPSDHHRVPVTLPAVCAHLPRPLIAAYIPLELDG